jgi:hypothetical protein
MSSALSEFDFEFDEERLSTGPAAPLIPQRAAQGGISGPLLAADVGSITTRAVLLDTAEGMYRLFATGEAPTSGGAPAFNLTFGLASALRQISETTGRQLIEEKALIPLIPSTGYAGVDAFVATVSSGQPVRVLLVGLVPDFSLASARKVVSSAYFEIAGTISYTSGDPLEVYLKAILDAEPDVILIVGGTDQGASTLVKGQIDLVALACSMLDYARQPTILFAGNPAFRAEISELFTESMGVRSATAANVRPALEREQLYEAQRQAAEIFVLEKTQNTGGFEEISEWAKGWVYPSAHGFGQLIQALGVMKDGAALGVDIGSQATTVAASINSQLALNTYLLGMGKAAPNLLDFAPPAQIAAWLNVAEDVEDAVQDYLWNKRLHPHIVPATETDRAFEYAAAREIARYALHEARSNWEAVEGGGPPVFNTVLLSGSVLTRSPHPGWSALLALDGLGLTGMTRLLIDPYCIAPGLGMLVGVSSQAVVQVLERGAFFDLGTLIAVTGRKRIGSTAVVAQVEVSGESPLVIEVPFGSLRRIRLDYGQEAVVTLKAQGVTIPGLGRGRHKLTLTGGQLGVVIDARGRPVRKPRNLEERQKVMEDWVKALTEERL